MIEVTLTQYEAFSAAMAGISRQLKSAFNGEKGYAGANQIEHGWQYHCDGALGEAAVAKWLDVYWSGSPGVYRSKPDVGAYEVRTKPNDWGDLFLRDHDKSDDTRYILVRTHRFPVFEIVGWITGAEGKQEKWLGKADKDRPPLFIVPHGQLHSMETFQKL